MRMTAAVSSIVLCVFLLTTSTAVPVTPAGLGAALTNIANSFVVVSEEKEQHVSSRLDTETPAVPHLESANVLPSLTHIALTPEEHHIKAETEELVYTNKTDAQGVVKITVVGEDLAEESTTDETTTQQNDDDDDGSATEEITTETEGGLTTVVPSSATSSSTVRSTTPTAILTVLGSDQVDKAKEEEIKQNIKEVEAMPVILTVGV